LKPHCSPLLKILYYVRNIKISNLFSEDISFAEYIMLQVINDIQGETGNPDIWVSDVVKRVEVTPQAVSKFITMNERKGYLERFENLSDRRITGIRITDRGRSVLVKTEEELEVFRTTVFSEFSKEELTTMHNLAQKLHSAVQNNYEKFRKK
jgi:DNA-binding MarR family transcriptional regulator